LRIGDPVARLSSLGKAPSNADLYKSFIVRKWLLPNGNELSVTTSESGSIVYMESDWDGQNDETSCDLPGLKFGVTTLSELRKRLGSNGFEFQDRAGVIRTQGGIVMLNSYEVEATVVTFITKITDKEYTLLKISGRTAEISDYVKLGTVNE
jgi:hypothetical protein